MSMMLVDFKGLSFHSNNQEVITSINTLNTLRNVIFIDEIPKSLTQNVIIINKHAMTQKKILPCYVKQTYE